MLAQKNERVVNLYSEPTWTDIIGTTFRLGPSDLN